MKLALKMPHPKKTGIFHYNKIKNKICILRLCGGYGDILMTRMIFEDLKKQFPQFHITYAVPPKFFDITKDHPYIDEVIDCNKIDYNEYREVFNITHYCVRYESAKNKECDKNRSDIWAESFGLKLENHNMHLPDLTGYKDLIYSFFYKGGYKNGQKILAFTPFSAVPNRHITPKQKEFIEDELAKKNCFCFYIHNLPVLEAYRFPLIGGMNLLETMGLIFFSDAVVSTDTGHLHCAGGYNKPTLGVFNYTNGYVVGKHYKNLIVVQKDSTNDPEWKCGPCNDVGRCPYPIIENKLKCGLDLSLDHIKERMDYFFNKFDI